MKKITLLKTLLMAVGLCMGGNAWAQITGLPTTYTSNYGESSIAPFEVTAATVNTVNSTNCGYLLRAFAAKNSTATATAYFDSDTSSDGNQEYTLSANEQITISFMAYHGYYAYDQTTKFAVNNSDGTELVSYTYNPHSTNCVTDVSLGGSTADGFEAFNARSYWSTTTEANGFTDASKPYQTTAGYNPTITITISQNGAVSINFTQAQRSLNSTYSKKLSAVKMDLDNITMTNSISGRDNNADRALGIGNITISSATIPKADVTFQYYDTSDNSLSSLKADYVSSEEIGANIS